MRQQHLLRNGDYSVQAFCPGGTKVLSGGVQMGWLGQSTGVSESYPTDDGSSWVAEGSVRGETRVQVEAICSSVALEPDVQYRVVHRQATIGVGENLRFEVRCGSFPDTADTVVGGGLVSSARMGGALMQSSPTADGRGWVVEWENTRWQSTSLVGRAVCMYVPRESFEDVMSAYEIVAADARIPLPGLSTQTAKADCPAGKHALGGGLFASRQASVRMLQSYPGAAAPGEFGNGTAWVTEFGGTGRATGETAVTRAICAFVPGVGHL